MEANSFPNHDTKAIYNVLALIYSFLSSELQNTILWENFELIVSDARKVRPIAPVKTTYRLCSDMKEILLGKRVLNLRSKNTQIS